MASVELVIKIPEELKNDFILGRWTVSACVLMASALEKAIQLPIGNVMSEKTSWEDIKNGKPLPPIKIP